MSISEIWPLLVLVVAYAALHLWLEIDYRRSSHGVS